MASLDTKGVWVGGLLRSTTRWREVLQALQALYIEGIVSVNLRPRFEGNQEPTCIVNFQSPEHAAASIHALHGRTLRGLSGRPLEVRLARVKRRLSPAPMAAVESSTAPMAAEASTAPMAAVESSTAPMAAEASTAPMAAVESSTALEPAAQSCSPCAPDVWDEWGRAAQAQQLLAMHRCIQLAQESHAPSAAATTTPIPDKA
jgi:hypothetical protein